MEASLFLLLSYSPPFHLFFYWILYKKNHRMSIFQARIHEYRKFLTTFYVEKHPFEDGSKLFFYPLHLINTFVTEFQGWGQYDNDICKERRLPSFCLSVHLCIHAYLSTHISLYLYISIYLYLSIYLPIYLSIYI